MPDNEPDQTPEIPEVPEPESNEAPTEQAPVEETKEEKVEEEKTEESPSPTEEGETQPIEASKKETLSKSEETPKPPSSILIDKNEVPVERLISAWKEREAAVKLQKEGKELHDTAKYILEQIPKDPKAVFIDIMTGMMGSKEKATQEWVSLCEKEIYQQLKLAEMPEGERKALQLEEQLKEERRRNEEFRKKEEAATFEAMRAKRANEIFGEIKSAIKKADLSDNPEIIRRVATKMHAMADVDPTFTAEDAAALVAEEEEEILKKIEIDKLQKKRPDLIEKVRKTDLEQIRSSRMVSKKPQKAETPSRSGEKKPITSAEFLEQFG